MSWTDASRPRQTPQQGLGNSSNPGESSRSAATPAAEQSSKSADAADVKAGPEQPATPAAAAELRTAPSDQAPRAGKPSPGLKSIEAVQAIAKIGQDQDGPPPPSTPLEIASSVLWPELLILDFAVYEARAGLAGLFARQDLIQRTMYEAGPAAYARDLEAYTEECQRSTSEIERWRALLKRHALPIGSLSRLHEICDAACDMLTIVEEWEHLRAKEPWRDWLNNRDVVDPFFGVRMPASPAANLDCTKLVASLFGVLDQLAPDDVKRPMKPRRKRCVGEAAHAITKVLRWCDAAKRRVATPTSIAGRAKPLANGKPKLPGVPKRNGQRSDALNRDALVKTALAQHHEYDGTSIGNWEPLKNVDLAKKTEKSSSATSKAITGLFGSYEAYARACRDKTILGELKARLGEFSLREVRAEVQAGLEAAETE